MQPHSHIVPAICSGVHRSCSERCDLLSESGYNKSTMLDRQTTHKLWMFQYLMPVLFSFLFYVARVMPNDQSYAEVIWFVLGSYIGNVLLWADSKFLYPSYNELQTFPQKLITRSILFVLAFTGAALFILSSSGSSLGAGIVMGLGISLAGEMAAYVRQPQLFQQRFLFQLRRIPTKAEMYGYVVGFSSLLIILSGLFLLRG